MKLAVFAYNFPHKKTQDFLLRLFMEGCDINFTVACDPVELNIPKPILRVKPIYTGSLQTRVICQRLNIPYYVLPHNSEKVAELLRDNNIDVGIIAGARILKKNIIGSVRKGIVNFHPGLIPRARGLDALKWAVYYDMPIGVTAHFIDERVDAGRILLQKEIPIYRDDTFIDISLRLDETQVELLPEVLKLVEAKSIGEFPLVSSGESTNPSMPNELEKELPDKLKHRLASI